MNKAVPWNISGVGFDARETAREAARRQGKSLGEWLHGVIADHAADLGVDARDVADQDRIQAVTAKLERLSGRTADFERRPQRETLGDSSRRAPPRRDLDEDEPAYRRPVSRRDEPVESRRGRRAPMIEETEFLLDEAIDAMERRAARTERRTDDAFASVTRMLEANEAKRDRERDTVQELAQKLNAIETKLTARAGSVDEEGPIKGVLSRLEARLETISRRAGAEGAIRQLAPQAASAPRIDPEPRVDQMPRVDHEPIRRLEDKLNTILAAVAAPPRAPSPLPVALAQEPVREEPLAKRRLGDAIAEIARRQRALDTPMPTPDSTIGRPQPGRERSEDRAWQPALAALQTEIGTLAGRIEDMRRDVRRQAEPAAASHSGLDGLRTEIDAMSKTLRDLAPRSSVVHLQESIDTLTKRVATSRDQGVRETVLRPVEAAIGDLRLSLPSIDPRPAIGLIEREVKAIAEKVDRLSDANTPALERLRGQMEEIRDLLSSAAAAPLAIEDIEQRVSALTAQMDRIVYEPGAGRDLGTAADGLRAMIAAPPGTAALDKIETRLEALTQKLDSLRVPPDTRAEVAGLETLVRDLGRKIEAAQAPGADNRAIEALQQQIALLAARFERSESGLSSLANLERSMQSLFAHLEQTRARVETSAAEAAREVLRVAMDEGRGPTAGATTDLALLKALQAQAEERTQTTLNAVHQTLEHVVGRMSAMEANIVQSRRAPAPPAMSAMDADIAPSPRASAPAAKSTRDVLLPSVDTMREPLFATKPKMPQPGIRPLPDDDTGRADFIAAARRAAQAAQSEASVNTARQSVNAMPADTRAGLLARSRDYVATHKRPVLLSVAAVFVVLGTMAIVQRMTFDSGSDDRVAALTAPAQMSRMADANLDQPVVVGATRGDLTPSALPVGARALAAQIPGSDPIPTGSIPTPSMASLPAFAAQAPTAAPPPALPATLVNLAQAGNGAAEYELASRYADGKSIPRDFKVAVSWYEKAADQGLAPAQYRLAALYEKGLGVPQDKEKAKSLYLQSAEAGNPRAMHNLAVLLADGNGRPDYAGAATWFRKAAQYGVHDSQYNLAILLARGLGVDQSMVQSYQWFAIAATHDDADAARKRDEVGDKLNANDLAVAKALAASFQPRTASVAATDVTPPPGGWDGVGASSQINSGRSTISSL